MYIIDDGVVFAHVEIWRIGDECDCIDKAHGDFRMPAVKFFNDNKRIAVIRGCECLVSYVLLIMLFIERVCETASTDHNQYGHDILLITDLEQFCCLDFSEVQRIL